MEENITTTTTTTTITTETKRPTFLTVLCILTFIGSGWGIISALAFQDQGLTLYAGYYSWITLLFNVGTLAGALLMWKQKKTGLYLWTLSEILTVVMMWVVIKGYIASLAKPMMTEQLEGSGMEAFGTTTAAAAEAVFNMALILGSVFPVLFIILYWVNAKHLK